MVDELAVISLFVTLCHNGHTIYHTEWQNDYSYVTLFITQSDSYTCGKSYEIAFEAATNDELSLFVTLRHMCHCIYKRRSVGAAD